MMWKVTKVSKDYPKLNNPVLIEGLPGIGNVGKVAVDFMIDELKTKKLAEFFSYSMPHSVFVNEDNLVELPSIEVYYKKFGNKKKRDIVFLAGDMQPIDEVASYAFTEKVLDLAEKLNCREIITIGGIGLNSIPKKPKVYCTANNKRIIQKYKNGTMINDKLYGVVGPIVGVSGLLIGLAEKRKIDAISLLAETLGHPMYLGIKGSKEILAILDKHFSLGIDLKRLDKDIKEVEEGLMKKTQEFAALYKHKKLKKLALDKEISYIG